MTDISKCKGDGCPIRNNCYRYTAPAEPRWQSFFIDAPYDHDLKLCGYQIRRSENNATHTSRESLYYERRHFTAQERTVIMAFAILRESCITEVAKHLRWEKSTVSRVFNDLRKKLAIIETDVHPCSITGKNVHYYKLFPENERLTALEKLNV
jgi:hypothetical protein